MKEIKIGNNIISENNTPIFIGEIGINHNGSIDTAKKLIDLAVLCNVDIVKFQKKTPELCIPEHQKNIMKETLWGNMTYLEYKKKIEFGETEFKEIDRYCKEKGIIWFASVWDLQSVEFIEQFNLPFYKVPSAMLTYKELLIKLIETKKPIFLSTGMSTEEEIGKAVALFDKNYPLVIMHCNSVYPTDDKELNLLYIKKLKEKYSDFLIGYSGHEVGLTPSIIAVAMGARVIERHITLDRAMWGTDQAASLEFSGLRKIVRDIHNFDMLLGTGIKIVSKEEEKIKQKLRK